MVLHFFEFVCFLSIISGGINSISESELTELRLGG